MTGEINFMNYGNEVIVHSSGNINEVAINIGNSLWLILTKEQAEALKQKLNETMR